MSVRIASVKVVALRDIAVIPLMTALLKGADGPGIRDFSPHATHVATVGIGPIRIILWMMDADGPSNLSSG